jgi:UDP-N-acetyl-D-galactosamine dehydrogenase
VKLNVEKATVCVVGLGYVGLPLAEAFARKLDVIGFDTDIKKISLIKRNNNSPRLNLTTDSRDIAAADVVIICVPTPVTISKEPDLSLVETAAGMVGRNMKRGSIVILESTVYPGVTEEVVRPILEKESGLQCGADFKIGYSPERVNPNDSVHTIDKITKVVSAMDAETLEAIAELYTMVTADIFRARNIKTAEAAKVIENIQRDLNIALMNELSIIFERLGIDTREVIDAASTKWNFHRYSPGLVGGHCIPVDPYYLVHKAKMLGYHSQVILAGRSINDAMAKHVAEITIKAINAVGKVIKGANVLIMGLTYKENVADTRETPVKAMIKELGEYGVNVYGYDPLLEDIEEEFGIKSIKSMEEKIMFDGVVVAVGHDIFREHGDISLERLAEVMNEHPVIVDIQRCLDTEKAREKGFCYRTL